jgi:hypothetical protein
MLWNMSGAVVQAALQLAIVSVLARLLVPQDFGLVGAAVVVIEFCQIFTQIGPLHDRGCSGPICAKNTCAPALRCLC